jgi:nucleotide-binding universal stress UspA family protein
MLCLRCRRRARLLSAPGDQGAAEPEREAAQEAVAKSAGELGEAQPASVTVAVFSGFPAKALIKGSHGSDLIVIGSRGTGGFESLLLGSISAQVVHHAACPVVIVPSDR